MASLGADIRPGAARVAAVYLVVASAWIVLTDLGALQAFLDPITLTGVQTTKGLVFVTASAGLLYVLIAREQRRLADANDDLQLTLRHASVLHRLLRHNLRNSCDVIRNNVDLVREDRCAEERAFERIERQTDALADIAEKSGHLRDLVLADDLAPKPIDLADVVRRHAREVEAEYTDATVAVDAPAAARASVHPRIGVGVEELLRNGVTHADDGDTTVTVDVTDDGETVTVEVADEGPGLPEMELSALGAEMEDPLEHARGVGLWLVQFLVSKSDGSLATRDREGGGTVVRMRFDACGEP